MAKEYVVLTEEQFKDYKDPKECFGSPDKDFGFDETADACSPAECPDRELCKQLCNGAIGILEGTEVEVPEKVIEESVKEEVNEASLEWTRETVLKEVLSAIEDYGEKAEVTSTATRDKVFIEDKDVFVVTKKALKIHRLEKGEALEINSELWKEDNRGIVVTYDSSIHFKTLVIKALERLYVESLPKIEPPKVKTDLFEADTPPKENKSVSTSKPEGKEISKTTKPKIETKVTENSYIKTPEFDTGEVVKVLTVTKYANGYNEVKITFTGAIEGILHKLENIFG